MTADRAQHFGWWARPRIVALFVLAAVAPLFTASLPPLTDLAGHLGRYRIMLDGNAAPLAQWYHFEWRLVGNLGADLIVAGVAPVIGLESTVWLICLLIAATTALACIALSYEVHGRVTPFVYLALPLIWNEAFLTGFLNYTLAMSGVLWAFWLWLRLGRRGDRWMRALLFAPVGCLLWLMHVYGWAVLGLLIAGAELTRWNDLPGRFPRRIAHIVLACLPLALPVFLLLFWRNNAGGDLTTDFFVWHAKLLAIFGVMRDRWMAWDMLSAIIVIAAVAYGLRSPAIRVSKPLIVGAALMAIAFVLLPHRLFGSGYADARLVPYALMIALLALAPRAKAGTAPRLATGAVIFAALRLGSATASMAFFAAEWRDELAAVDRIRPGSRVASFVSEDCVNTWRSNRLDHLAGVALARRRAFSNEQWRLPGVSLIRIDYPAGGRFAYDPFQIVPCPDQVADPHFARLFRSLPADAFDYIWLLQPPAAVGQPGNGFTLIWTNGRSRLYARPQ